MSRWLVVLVYIGKGFDFVVLKTPWFFRESADLEKGPPPKSWPFEGPPPLFQTPPPKKGTPPPKTRDLAILVNFVNFKENQENRQKRQKPLFWGGSKTPLFRPL